MSTVVTVSSFTTVVMILFLSSLSLSQSEAQIPLPACPEGYQRNSLGLCEPIKLTPNLQNCPMGYQQLPPGFCVPVVDSSLPLNNVTNQTRNQGSSLVQQQPNIDGATSFLQQPPPLQQKPLTPPGQQQQWFTYRDPSGTFVISYPSSWISVPGQNGGIMFKAPPETFSDNYVNAAVLIISDRLPSLTNSLQAMTEYKLKSYSVSNPDDKLIQSQGTSLSGLPAHMVVIQFLNVGNFLDLWGIGKLMALEEWTVKDDKSYSILYITLVEKFESYLPVAQQMLNSFRIIS
jgi:hypothetical protein